MLAFTFNWLRNVPIIRSIFNYTACIKYDRITVKFAFKRPLLCFLKLLNIVRVIFSKIIIDRKKKFGIRKVDEEDFTTVFALTHRHYQ